MASRASRQERSKMSPVGGKRLQPKSAAPLKAYSKPMRPITGTDRNGNRIGPRPTVGEGTREQRRAAIDADAAAARRGARELQAKRQTRQANQEPAKTDLSVYNAVRTIKKKQAGDKKAIDTMSQ